MTPAALYTSFFTPSYEVHATRLIASLRAHSLPYVVSRVPAFSSWQAATLQKPAHLLNLRRQHNYRDRRLVWIDADAVIVRPPELLSAITDSFAGYWHHGKELFSGTLLFGTGKDSTDLLQAWLDGTHDTPDVIDQQILQRVLKDRDISTFGLPPEYCHIPGMTGEAVVAHKMASRATRP